MAKDGELLWQGSPGRLARANLTRFLRWLEDRGRAFTGCADLW